MRNVGDLDVSAASFSAPLRRKLRQASPAALQPTDFGQLGIPVVLPDTRTKLGGSWYVNSVTGGAWEDFVARDLVAHVDSTYRTIAERGSRGIAGQSMGGYGALRIAMNHPDTFGSVAGISAPNLVEPNPFGEDAARAAVALEGGPSANASHVARVLW